MQAGPHSSMQQTWSNDSLTQLAPSGSTSRHLSVDVDRPRKHARRTSLPVRNDGSGDGVTSRYTSERKRFRDSLNPSSSSSIGIHDNGITGKPGKGRRGSAPSALLLGGGNVHAANGGAQSRRKMFGVGEDEGDDEGEDEDEAALDTDDEEGVKMRGPSLHAIGRRTSSMRDSSTTYAAGPSSSGGGIGYTMEGGSSSDASSSDNHHFDWDVPKRRLTPLSAAGGSANNGTATMAAGLMAVAQPQHWTGRSEDTRGPKRTLSPRRRPYQSANGTGGSASPSSPTNRKLELEPEESGQSLSATSKVAQASAASASAGPARAPQHRQKPISVLEPARSRWSVPSNPTIEAGLLVLASVIVAVRLGRYPDEATQTHAWELMSLVVASSTYYLFSRRSVDEKGSIWATSLRQYRACGDDGAMCGLLLGPLLGVTCLFASLEDTPAFRSASGDGLPFPPWRVETPPLILGDGRSVPHPTMTALTLSRCTLLSLQTAMSTTLLAHLMATKYICTPDQIQNSSWRRLWSYVKFAFTLSTILTLMREAFSWLGVPLWTGLTRTELLISTLFFQSNLYIISQLARRSFTLGELAVVGCVGVTLSMETLNVTSARLFPDTTPFVKTFRRPTPLLIFQLALVVGTFMIGFLLSPLLYLSRHLAQKPVHRLRWPHKRDLHRRLLSFFFYFFAALYVVGVLGFWVYWLLEWKNPWVWTIRFVGGGQRVWSRPMLIVYWIALVGSSIAGWQATVLSGKRFRVRSAAAAHAVQSAPSAVGTSSAVAAQSKILPTSRLGLTSAVPPGVSANEPLEGAGKAKTATSTGEGGATNPLFPKRAAYLSLNARRKFFHALAVLLFAPGIAFDPAFTHLAFSLAFSVFIFAEYVRYYALYPFGAALHVFLSEFTDHKDSGPVILSHFYLLTGCAGGLWIEGMHGTSTRAGVALAEQIRNEAQSAGHEGVWSALLGTLRWVQHDSIGGASRSILPSSLDFGRWSGVGGQSNVDISMFIGVLTLGIGDALASIIGRRYGRVRWPDSGKTLEGTVAFVLSIFASAVVLRAIGWCAAFSLSRFAVVSVLLGIVEGISNQNDNLVLPIYGFIALSVMRV